MFSCGELYWPRHRLCKYFVPTPVRSNPDGTFGLTADLWNGHVETEVGQGYGKLLQLYGVHKATLEARKKGLSVIRRQQQNGSIKLVLMGVGV